MAGLRLVLGVEIKAGNEHTGSHSLPGLLQVLDGPAAKPASKDCARRLRLWLGHPMRPLEDRQQGYS